MRRQFLLLALALVAGCSKNSDASGGGQWTSKVDSGKDLYATIHTSMGDVELKLFSKDAPKTVKNFVGLATGEREWKNPATGELKKGVPLYNGVIFHRVIPGFMIQGGDPLGVGRGGPGYTFEDEFQSGRTFDKVGILAMANSGPATNGSQFFITTSMPQHLNGRHTIFGEVVKGYEVVEAISKVQTGPGNKPLQPITINSITLSDNP